MPYKHHQRGTDMYHRYEQTFFGEWSCDYVCSVASDQTATAGDIFLLQTPSKKHIFFNPRSCFISQRRELKIHTAPQIVIVAKTGITSREKFRSLRECSYPETKSVTSRRLADWIRPVVIVLGSVYEMCFSAIFWNSKLHCSTHIWHSWVGSDLMSCHGD